MTGKGFIIGVSLLSVSPVFLLSNGLHAAEIQNEVVDNLETLTSLRSELFAAKDDQARLDALTKIAGLRESGATAFLREYFQRIPLPEASTDPKRDSYREKVLGVILPVLGEEERNVFIAAVIRREAQGLRDAASVGVDRYYPKGVWAQTLDSLDRRGAEEVWQALGEISNDLSVPDPLRVAVKTSLILKDVGSDEGSVITSIRSMIYSMPIKPMVSVMPYDVFKDHDKRIAYGNSAEYQEKLLQGSRWRMSGGQAKYETVERVFFRFGLASVREIVAVLWRADVPKERKECLAMLATSVLLKLCLQKKQNGEPIDEESRLLATALAEYVDKMDDPGVFSYRYKAEKNLRTVFSTAAMPNYNFGSGFREMQKKHTESGEMSSEGRGKPVFQAVDGKLSVGSADGIGEKRFGRSAVSFMQMARFLVLFLIGAGVLSFCALFLRWMLRRK